MVKIMLCCFQDTLKRGGGVVAYKTVQSNVHLTRPPQVASTLDSAGLCGEITTASFCHWRKAFSCGGEQSHVSGVTG